MMKRILLTLSLAVAFSLSAQQDIYLEIIHEVNGQPFTIGAQGQNNLGDAFDVNRLEYYISRISIEHDGGQVIDLPDTYFLVNGSQNFDEMLGNFNVSQLESITFAIGVDSARNHLDPASWPSAHPLAPKSPSMHWGWSAGYRFAVMEGTSGDGLGQFYEFHALGNKNYTFQNIQTAGVNDNGDLVIRLIADYAEAFYNIPLDQGMIQHGQDDEAAEFLGNFALRVFESSDGNGPTASLFEQAGESIRAYPNPAARQISLDLSKATVSIDRFAWVNAQGAKVSEGMFDGNNIETPETNGVYLLQLYSGAEVVAVERVVVVR